MAVYFLTPWKQKGPQREHRGFGLRLTKLDCDTYRVRSRFGHLRTLAASHHGSDRLLASPLIRHGRHTSFRDAGRALENDRNADAVRGRGSGGTRWNGAHGESTDRKSTRLNSSLLGI